MHDIAWYLTLILIGLLIVVFSIFIASTGSDESYEDIAKRDYAPRGKIFWLVIFSGAIITSITLMPWPHSATADSANTKVVEAVASQWKWDMTSQQFHVGENVHFKVSSVDVNHGFGIYDEDLKMLTQIQAMPGYINSLHYKFTKPGKYKILCMEYCGLAHHEMMTTLTVLPAK